MKNNTELLKCISGAKNCFNKQIITWKYGGGGGEAVQQT
jgi:hypothetical protein